MEKKPLDPETREFLNAMSRRRLLQVGAIGGAAAVATACGVGSSSPSPTKVKDLSDKEKFFNWSTWIDYIDIDDAGNYPTLEIFQEQTGIKVEYKEDYNDNDEFLAKVRTQLEAGQGTGRDIVTPTDWMAGYWIRKGYAQKITAANVPNSVNMGDAWKGVGFDPNREFSLPWQSGFGGIGWNRAKLKELTGKSELTSLDELWDPKLKGRVTLLSEWRDTIGVTLQAMGLDASNFAESDFADAIALLQEQIDKGQIRAVMGNDYKTAMARGDVVAAIAWSGDLLNNTAKYGFAVPESGGTLWTDNMIIPIGATHKKNAEKWMNFYYEPENAARIAAYVNYITPVAGAQAAMEKIDPSMVNNEAIFPTDATLSRVKTFMALSDEQQASFTDQFSTLSGA